MHHCLEERVRGIIARHLHRPPHEIESEHRLRQDLGLLDLGLISIGLDLEDSRLGDFPFQALTEVDTVSDLTRMCGSLSLPR